MGDPQSGHGSMPIPSMPLTDIQKWKDFCLIFWKGKDGSS